MNPSPRFRFADGLRGLAASWVVLYHASEGRHLEQLRALLPAGINVLAFDWGWLGVPVFFVLSGFVVAHAAGDGRMGWRAGRLFMLRRIVRLTPPYYASIALVLFLAAVSTLVKGGTPGLPDPGRVGAHLLYLQDFLAYEPLNPVYWTLAIEMQFYLAYCVLLAAGEGLRRHANLDRRLPFVLAAAAASLWPLGLASANPWPGGFLPTWHAFLLGVFTYWSCRRTLHPAVPLAYAGLLLVPLGSGPQLFTLAAACTALPLYGAAASRRVAGWLGWGWLQFLGAISFSLYLVHNPVTGAAFFVIYRVFGRSLWTEAAGLGAVFLCCVLAAWLFHRLVERPSMRWSRGVTEDPVTAVARA